MKKTIIRLLKNFLFPVLWSGLLFYFFEYLMVEKKFRSNPETIRAITVIASCGAVFFGILCYYAKYNWEKSGKVYKEIDLYKDKIAETFDLSVLETLVKGLMTYKDSKDCYSGEHKRYANDIINLGLIKMNTIQKTQESFIKK